METAVNLVLCSGVGDFSVDLLSVPLSVPGIYIHHSLAGDTRETPCYPAVRYLGRYVPVCQRHEFADRQDLLPGKGKLNTRPDIERCRAFCVLGELNKILKKS